MPKIIENLENKIFEEVQNQLKNTSYTKLTIRSIARACDIGIGTLYNYFPSKDSLVATYLLKDWNSCLEIIYDVSSTSTSSPHDLSFCIFEQIVQFMDRHQNIFQDEAAIRSFKSAFSNYHSVLRNQLAAPLKKFCKSDFHSEFIAEAFLTWITAGKSFDEIWDIIQNCF